MKNSFDSKKWEHSTTALGLHNFDDLLREPNENEVVHRHTGLMIKKAIHGIIWDVYHLLGIATASKI